VLFAITKVFFAVQGKLPFCHPFFGSTQNQLKYSRWYNTEKQRQRWREVLNNLMGVMGYSINRWSGVYSSQSESRYF
jgi:hypothetical protein